MSNDIGVFIAGARELELKFDEFPQDAHKNLREAISGLTSELEAVVLSLIPRKSGRLASEVKKSLYDSAERITGRVDISAEFAKAGALEYGAHRRTSVAAHQMRLSHLWARATRTPMIVSVPEYSRTPNIAEHDFMRGGGRAMQGRAQAVLTEAVSGTSS